MATFELSINGKTEKVDASPEMPLLWVIRDLVGLKGTKFGCGAAQCRACTVHVDGAALFACQLAVKDMVGKQITTIEGLQPDLEQPLTRAWIEHQVPQCGYCQVGQIMSAAALLRDNPEPTDEEIDAAMWNNLCRCGTYVRIRKAIHRAAEIKGGAK